MRRDFETATALQNLCDALEYLEAAIKCADPEQRTHLLANAREERQRVERAIKPIEGSAT